VKSAVLIIWSLLLMVVLSAGASAMRRIHVEVTVREKQPGGDSQFVLIEKKQLPVYEGIKTTTFIVNFTLDMTATCSDSGSYGCDFSLFTLGPQAQTFFKEFHSQAGGVYFLDNVRGKEGVVYRVGISPLTIDTAAGDRADCDFNYRKDGVWNFDPSANFDFYFIPKSLADARWNGLRDFMEVNFKDFKELFQLNFPGKINCFLSPCAVPEVIWDGRMGYAIDPPRSNCFVLYSHDDNTVDPMPAYLTRIYRFLGYAPPLLAEGMAAYFEFPHFYARTLKRSHQLPRLNVMLKSVDYFSLPENNNVSAAASFVKYLLDTYGLNRFTDLYRAASDLTMTKCIADTYGKPLDSLERDWLAALDTVTFSFGQLKYFYERERAIQREPGMDLFLNEMKTRAGTAKDSLFVLSEEAWNQYMRGDFSPATAKYAKLLATDPSNSTNVMVYGNLLLIDGQHDSAIAVFQRLLVADSTAKSALLKIGEAYYWMNQIDSAQHYLLRDVSEDGSQLSRAAAGVLLGELALREHDTAAAVDYYAAAKAALDQIAQFGGTRPSYLLRLGQAYLGLAMCGKADLATAKSALESADYFEVHPVRAIFITRILWELGQIADLEHSRDEAMAYYRRALTYPLSSAFEKRVRAAIITPFAGYGR